MSKEKTMLFMEQTKSNNFNSDKRGIFCIIAAAAIFGMMLICAKTIYAAGGNSWFLSFLRFSLALPLLALLNYKNPKKKKAFRMQKPLVRDILFLSAGLAATPISLFWSYDYISSALSTTLHFIYPFFVLLFCAVFFHEKVSAVQKICCFLCLFGVLLFYTPDGQFNALGVVLALISGLTYGGYVVWLGRSGIQEEMGEYQLLLYLQAVSSLILLAVNICLNTFCWRMPWTTWLLCILFGSGVTAATLLFQRGIKLCGPQYASFLSVTEPATSALAGAFLLKETLTVKTIAGILCVLLATVLIANQNKKE